MAAMQNLMCASRTLFDEFSQTEREYRAREAELQREIDALRTRVAELEERIEDQDDAFNQIETMIGQTWYFLRNAGDMINEQPSMWNSLFVNGIIHWHGCFERIWAIVIER